MASNVENFNGPAPVAPTAAAPTQTQDFERGLASFVAVSRERDALLAKVNVLEIAVQGKDAEIKALRDMLTFSEEQSRLRELDAQNRINTYRNERDDSIAGLAKSEQKFEDLFKTMVGVLQAARAQGGELVRKHTDGAAR